MKIPLVFCVCFRGKGDGEDNMACFRNLPLSSVLKLTSEEPLNLYLWVMERRSETAVFVTV